MNFNYNYSKKPSNKPKISHNAVPPPTVAGISKQGYSTMNAISQNALSASWGGSRKRVVTEDEYFNDDDEENASGSGLAYIPAPGSPSAIDSSNNQVTNDEDDPLDAFMASIEKQVEKEQTKTPKAEVKVVRNDIEEEDVEESYYRYMEENPNAGLLVEEDNLDVEYDEDGNPIPPDKKKFIDPLPPIDHDEIHYEPFRKDFYQEHEDIKEMNLQQIIELRNKFDLNVVGNKAPKPVSSFAHFNFDDKLMKSIIKAEYVSPTPIQLQGVPCALLGRDVLGIAQTGSGKTAAFLWPLLVHVAAQKAVEVGEGPIALILAPTRELAMQIYNEGRKFARVYDLRIICAYGGGSKWEQSQALKEGAEIVVATPGRIIDHIKGGATNLQRVTFLVLDEADRMFELGFEPQVRSVINHVRPDRQTLLFSATFKKRIEKLAKDALQDPIKISQGLAGQANEDVTQHAILLANQDAKKNWLACRLVEFTSAGSVLIFVTKKLDAEQVSADLKLKQFDCLLLHGDMEQADRNKVITAFKKSECSIMVATDVAARGLDIPQIRTVVNYDIARDIDTHTHRVGRTGRAGTHGTAYTLLTDKDKEFAGHIVRNLEAANQLVPQEVLDLALQSSWFKKARYKKKDQGNIGGLGLGFVEKVGKPMFSKATSSGSGGTGSGSNNGGGGGGGAPRLGPGSDRLSAMKAAFKAQYQNQFTTSSHGISSESNVQQQAPLEASPTTNKPSTRKKSRWE